MKTPELTGRLDWDGVWMRMADTMAMRSKCSRTQVGVVLVSKDQRVLSSAYNGPPAGYSAIGSCINWCPRAKKRPDDPLDGVYDDCHAAHAEANAIARADYSQMQGSTIYVSTSMCKGCAKISANSGVERIVYRHSSDGQDAYRSPTVTEDFLRECGVMVDRWSDK